MIFGELGLPQSPLDELCAPVRPTHRASPQHSWVGGSREVGVPRIHTHHTGLQLLKVSSIRTAQTSLNRDSLGKPTFFPLPFAFLISFLLPKFLPPPLSWQHSMSPPLLPDVSRSRTFCGILEIFPAPSSSWKSKLFSFLLYLLKRGRVQTQEPKVTQSGEEGALGDSPPPRWKLGFCFSVTVSKYTCFELYIVHTDRFNLFIMALFGFSHGLKSPSQALLACVNLLQRKSIGSTHGEASSIIMAVVGTRPMYSSTVP